MRYSNEKFILTLLSQNFNSFQDFYDSSNLAKKGKAPFLLTFFFFSDKSDK